MIYQNLRDKIIESLFVNNEDEEELFPFICGLHEDFETSEFLEDNENAHNCLGCNFASYKWGLLHTVESWLAYEQFWNSQKDEDSYISIYSGQRSYYLEDYYMVSNVLHWLNIMVSAYLEIFKIIKIDYDESKNLFPIFTRIKFWTNFFKHPKAMMLTHNAKFVFDSSDVPTEKLFGEEKIKKYYTNSNNNEELFEEIANKSNLVIHLPNLIEFIEELGISIEKFQTIITENPSYLEILGRETTYQQYYKSLDNEIEK